MTGRGERFWKGTFERTQLEGPEERKITDLFLLINLYVL